MERTIIKFESSVVGPNRKILQNLNLKNDKRNNIETYFSYWTKPINEGESWIVPLLDEHSIQIAKYNDEIIGWAVGVEPSNLGGSWIEFYKGIDVFEKNIAIIGVYVSKEYRGEGIGLELGKNLLIDLKKNGINKFFVCPHTKASKKMYKNLSKLEGNGKLTEVKELKERLLRNNWRLI